MWLSGNARPSLKGNCKPESGDPIGGLTLPAELPTPFGFRKPGAGKPMKIRDSGMPDEAYWENAVRR
jgi:hypothetical protein